MLKKNSTSKNAIWIISCTVIQSLLGMIISMLSARYLGPSGYGLISYAASIAAFLLPLVQLGFRSTLVRELVEDPEREGEILGTAIFFSVLSALVCMLGLSSFVMVANPGEKTTLLVCFLYSISLFTQALYMIQYWFQAKLISQYSSITGLFAYLVVSAYKIYLLATKKSIYWFAVTHAMDYFLVAVILIFFFHKLSSRKLTVSFARFKKMFSQSRHFIISSLMVTIFAQTDKIMLKNMLTEEAVGIYSAAVTCAGLTSFVFGAIIDSFRPFIFENKKNSPALYEESLISCYSVVIYLSLFQSIFFALFAKPIILLLYGKAYLASAAVLSLVVWYTTFSYLGPVRNVWILAEKKQKYLWMINLSGALTNVFLNLFLISLMGVMGAALASLVTQFFTNFLIGFILKPISYNNILMLKGLNPVPLWQFAKGKISKILKKK